LELSSMQIETVGDKLVLKRTPEELMPLKQRLNRVEGQIRGLRHMVESHRPCAEAIQQSSAAIAALREVALMLISQHLHGQASRLDAPEQEQDLLQSGRGIADFVNTLRLSYQFV
jgi:DNA-binding FrmR family transcriptional regulator